MYNIYENTLNRWFERVFRNDNAALGEMKGVFDALDTADRDMFEGMAKTAERVQQLANNVLDLVSRNKQEDARKTVLASFAEVNPLRVKMNELMAKLYELRAKLIEISGT